MLGFDSQPMASKDHGTFGNAPFYLAVALLLGMCGIDGHYLVHGLPYPPYEDSLRDIGLIQGILDGNFLHDPTNAGAWNWYPPLIHLLIAAAVTVTGADLVRLWLDIAPWINLLPPIAFFLLCVELMNVPAATFALFVFVFWNGALIAPWDAATYAPWPHTPPLAQTFFFASLYVIRRAIASPRLAGAAWSGAMIGATFLAHSIPGLILVPITVVGIVVARGLRLSTLLWLAVAGIVAAALALLFLGPLIVDYRLAIVNFTPAAHAFDGLFDPGRNMWLRVAVHAPAVIALLAIFVMRDALDRKVVAIIGTWVTVCVLALVRHFACFPFPTGSRRCDAFVLPIQHFHVYLQAAEAIIIGYAAWLFYQRLLNSTDGTWPKKRLYAGGAILAILLLLGGTMFIMRPDNRNMAARINNDILVDYELYRWILVNSNSDDLFLTDLPNDVYGNRASFAVLMAGRRLVAAPAIHSNPYLDWQERNLRRSAFYQAALGAPGTSPSSLCKFIAEARPGTGYIILPLTARPIPPLGEPRIQSSKNAIFKLPATCNDFAAS